MSDLQLIHEKHSSCGCVMRHYRPATLELDERKINHHACSLCIIGFRLAIDIDRCSAFTETHSKRPDLLVFREKDSRCEWLIIEIKTTADSTARDQIVAGLKTLVSHPLFQEPQDYKAKGFIAFTKANRTADLTQLRKPLRIGGRQVPISIHRCGQNPV